MGNRDIEPWEYLKFEPWDLSRSALNLEEFFDLAEVMGSNVDKIYEAYEMSHFIAMDAILTMISQDK